MYRIIIDDPEAVAKKTLDGVNQVPPVPPLTTDDAFYFNWLLHVDLSLQLPF